MLVEKSSIAFCSLGIVGQYMKIMLSKVDTIPNYCHIVIFPFENFEQKLFPNKSVNTRTAVSGAVLGAVLRIKSDSRKPYLKK